VARAAGGARAPARARRRATSSTRLVDASVVWRDPTAARERLIVMDRDQSALSTDTDPNVTPPIHPAITVRRWRVVSSSR
jgi:hypothetical protein